LLPDFTLRRAHDTIDGVKAVLWDMDGTLVDSEKIWDISLAALYDKLGGELTPAVRASMVGSVAETTMRIVYTDLGLDLDPVAMERSSRWLNDYTAELFEKGLPWCGGAKELLDEFAAEGTPMALVTNTQRTLTERALKSIGPHYFSVTVCGDEVANGKPAPDSYLRAADLLAVLPENCLAVEDSVAGSAAAERAGCPVLVVPNDVEVPGGNRRRHASSLAGLGAADLRVIHSQLTTQCEERSA
jgi:HAD superfamily hydrolase (TIGR01509 family)